MSISSTSEEAGKQKTQGAEEKPPKYPQPKILLLDLESEVASALEEKGYNVTSTSLGTPYLVSQSSGLFPVDRSFSLPHDYKEFEVVVIDLHYELEDKREIFDEVEVGVDDWWTDHKSGYVNPRLLNASFLQKDFDRILNTGGVFVVFANRFEIQDFRWGHRYGRRDFSNEERNQISNWSFLSLTRYTNDLSVGDDHGAMIKLSESLDKGSLLAQLLSKYLDDAKYDCTVAPGYDSEREWVSLLENKFGSSVGCVIVSNERRKGLLFIFPDIADKATFTREFIDQVLPDIAPKLFPYLEGAHWINRPEYELTRVQQLKEQVVEIRERVHTEIASLEQSILEEKEKYSYLFDLITENDDALVQAVIGTLKALGFSKVVDVDEELAKQGIKGQNREDLQIHDQETTLIAEVKGKGSYPKDEDALVVQKYVHLRMKEWDRRTVQGISIINHQRHLPPLERENAMPFRQEILDAAEEDFIGIGLITAWDLHRLARSFIQNGWEHENIRDLFYQSGRIHPIPNHYEYVGTIERYMEIDEINVIGVQIEEGTIRLGDGIAFKLPVLFEEQVCESMQFEKVDIEEAKVGMLVGIETHLTKDQAIGTRVYRIRTANNAQESDQNGE